MILCNGRAIFHEKGAKRSRRRDSNLLCRKHRATGDSGGAGPIPGSRGKPKLARVGRSSGAAGRPETQGFRIGKPAATGNRSGHGTERQARNAGQPEFRDSRTGGSGNSGRPRFRTNRKRCGAATGDRSCGRIDESEAGPGDRNCRRAETNFRKQRATEASTERRATGVTGNARETGDFERRRAGSLRGTVTERARGAGAQALRPRATAKPGS
jgi:hypothetical protein